MRGLGSSDVVKQLPPPGTGGGGLGPLGGWPGGPANYLSGSPVPRGGWGNRSVGSAVGVVRCGGGEVSTEGPGRRVPPMTSVQARSAAIYNPDPTPGLRGFLYFLYIETC